MDERFWCPDCESIQAADGMHDCDPCYCECDDTPLGTCAPEWDGVWASLHCRECCTVKECFKLLR